MFVEHGGSFYNVAWFKRFRPIGTLKLLDGLSQLLVWIGQWLLFCLICVAWVLLSKISKALGCMLCIQIPSSVGLLLALTDRARRDMIRSCMIVIYWRCPRILVVLSCWSTSYICEVGVLADCWWLSRWVELLIRILALLLQVNGSWQLLWHLFVTHWLLFLRLLRDLQVGGTDWTLTLAIVHRVRMCDNLLVLDLELVIHGLCLCGVALVAYNQCVIAVLVVLLSVTGSSASWFVLGLILIGTL